MKMRRSWRGVAMAVCLLCGVGAAGAQTSTRPGGTALLSSDEVKALMDAGQYADALRAVSRIVLLTGPAAAPYNRHQMLMLKAECQLQVKQYAPAIGTAEMAKKEAVVAHKDDEAMEAAAFEELMQSSPNGAYVPKTAAVKLPLKLADRDKRKQAYESLYADQQAIFDLKTAAAEKGTSLAPYLETARLTPALKIADYGATGATTESDKAVKDLADHAAKLVDGTLDDMSGKVDKITEEANRIITLPSNVTDRSGHSYQSQISHRQGLQGTDAQDLRDIDATCKKIPQAMLEFIKAFTDQADPFKKCAGKAQDVSVKAQKALNADYTQM